MRIVVLFYFFLINIFLFSQEIPISFIWSERQQSEAMLQKQDSFFHAGIFPLTMNKISSDSLFVQQILGIDYTKKPYFKNLAHHSFVQVKDNDFLLHINPILNEQYSNLDAHKYSQNTRGVIISGQFEHRFRFVSTMIETQAYYQDYIVNYVKKNGVVPGSGRVRGFKDGGYDFSQASGYVQYEASPRLQFMLGHSSQFIGYGYRSVLLSDAPLDYPFFRASYTFKKIQYSATYAVFQSASAFDDRTKVYSRKYSSQHYISYLASKWLEVGLFENTLFNSMSLQNNRPPEEFYSPIIGSDLLFFGVHQSKNVMLGTQSQLSFSPQLKIYGQFALDDLKNKDTTSANKYAWQCVLKIFEPFKIKNLFLIAEFNYASKAMYITDNEREAFTQHNESIAHPLGNYFTEKIFLLNYTFKRFFVSVKWNDAHYAAGENRLFLSDSTLAANVKELQHVHQYKVETGYILHRPSRLQFVLGIQCRNESAKPSTYFVYAAIRTNIMNFYDDF